MDDRAAGGPHPAVTAHAIGWNQGRHAKTPLSQGQGMCMTERAGAHSLQFGTYAFWTAGLLAALAVRPVPSCPASLTRGVNDQPPSDVCSGQAACRYLRPVITLRPGHPAAARCLESSPARMAAPHLIEDVSRAGLTARGGHA
jgi:hypothetical protein